MNRTNLTRLEVICFMMFFLVSPLSATWKEAVLYSFQGGTDGATPVGGVVFDTEGNLYGATQYGGSDNCAPMAACGTIYQLAPQKDGSWKETLLYVFKGKAFNDGEYPEGGVIADSGGNLYGTAAYGGTGNCVLAGSIGGCGAVFELSPPKRKGGAWTETILYSFPTAEQGYVPWGDLVFDKSGNLYGATIFGGGKGTTCDPFYQYCGTVFELSPPENKGGKWTEKVLHRFAGSPDGEPSGDGANPNGGLVLDSRGVVYGTTYYGGNNQKGTCEGGAWGTGCGTVFKLTPPTNDDGEWKEELVHKFGGRDGSNPAAGTVFGDDDQLYGVTSAGGSRDGGTIFILTPSKIGDGWTENVIHEFVLNGQNGCCAAAGLLRDTHGRLYGTALSGSPYAGLLFEITPPAHGSVWPFRVLYNFTGPPDGAHPAASLIFDEAGNVYSTTQSGGTGTECSWDYGPCGTVFEVSP
jgi:uncharacterized repeat protein (TIGR03803 family)